MEHPTATPRHDFRPVAPYLERMFPRRSILSVIVQHILVTYVLYITFRRDSWPANPESVKGVLFEDYITNVNAFLDALESSAID